jgi:Tol biopolymer transport system component
MRALLVSSLAGPLLLSTGALLSQDRYPVHQLTTHPAQEGFPTWSPDGTRIAYALIAQPGDTGLTGLWMVSAEGGEPERVLGEIAEHPDWSPDGQYVAFDADSGAAIRLVAAHGGQPIRLVPSSIPVLRGGMPNWSPDGTRIVFKGARPVLWVLDVRTGDARVVFGAEGTLPIPGCWAPDGSAVYFIRRNIDSQRSTIWAAPLDPGPPRQVTPESDRPYRYLDLSPDGTLLAFSWCEGRNCDLWVAPAGVGRPVRLTMDPAYDDTPRWSPDGRRIAFTSTRADGFDVWIMTLDVEDSRGCGGGPARRARSLSRCHEAKPLVTRCSDRAARGRKPDDLT